MNKVFLLLFLIPLFLNSCSKNKEQTVVAIQPFDDIDQAVCDSVKKSIESYYGFSVYILKAEKFPANAFIKIKSPRYRADSLIHFLRMNKPESADYILGLTSKDISITKYEEEGKIKEPVSRYKDFGIFGFGFRPGVSCIVSTYRLNKRHTIFLTRIRKVALHELGHNLGLPHCENSQCFMRSAAEKIQTIDQVPMKLCDRCKEKIN